MSLGLDPLRQVRGIGIDQYKAGLGEYLGAVASDAWANGPLAQAGRLIEASGQQADAEDRGEALLSAEEASTEGRDLGLRFDAPIARGAYNVLADEKRREVAAEATFKRARLENGYGTLHWLLGGGTEFLTQAADPLNIASAFIPVVGEARYAAMAARMGRLPAALAKGAAEGAVGQGLLEPLQITDRRQMGDDYTMLDTLTNLAFGGGLGVVLHGAGYGLGAGFRFMRDRYGVKETAGRAADTEALAARDERLATPEGRPEPPTIEKVAEPPPRQPVAEQMEKLRPETKDAAMRTAIAQLAQDKPVDIEPVLRADPGWREIRASIQAARNDIEQLQAQSAVPPPPGAIEPPPEWQPAAEDLKLAARVAKGWTPDVALARPQSLVDFVRKNGGLLKDQPEASDLLAQDIGRQPGLLRTKEGGGRSHDDMAVMAREQGYNIGPDLDTGNGINAARFLEMLVEDASGRRKHFPDDAHTEAWRVQQDYFENFARDLETRGIHPKGMEPRQVAWLLAQDADTQRLMSLLHNVDRLGPDTSLELAMRLEAERVRLESEVAAAELEPGALERDAGMDHRELPAATLAELERFYADTDRAAGPREEGQEAAGGRPGERRPDQGGQADAAGRDGRDAAAEGAGLRREGGQGEGAEGSAGAAGDLSGHQERPGFRRWFEGSKVVNDDGSPRIVFHGTIEAFDQFDLKRAGAATGAPSAREGLFFAADPEVANSYAEVNAYRDMDGAMGAFVRTVDRLTLGYYSKFNEKILTLFGGGGLHQLGSPNVRPAYVQLRNPKIIDQGGRDYREQSYYDAIKQAKEEGHDGVIFRDTFDPGFKGGEGKTDVYVVFSEKQVRPFSERYQVPEQLPTPEAPPTPEELGRFAERQQQADLHADPDALQRRDERLAGEARETAQLLADDLQAYGHLLDENARAIFDQAGRFFDEETKAIDSLAACRIGGGA